MCALGLLRAAIAALFLAALPADGRANTFVAFGPRLYVRDSGKPSPVTQTFNALDPTASFTLRVDSSGVSAAKITLNGVDIFRQRDFNANTRLLTKPVRLLATNRLTVELLGKPGESLTLQFIGVDNTPPTITAVVSPAPNPAGWNNSNPTVVFSCSDKTSGIGLCTAPVEVTEETAGLVVHGTARDKAGNASTTSVEVKLDRTPPSLSVTSPADGAKVFTSPSLLGGTAAEALSGLAGVTCNGALAALRGDSFSCGVTLAPGRNSASVKATDIAGNTVASQLSLLYAPVPGVKFTAPANLSYLGLSPTTVTGTVDDPTATVTVNSIAAPVGDGRFSVTLPLAEGPNIITATATSSVGAVGTVSMELTLDTTPPRVTINSPSDTFVTSDESVTVSGNVNDIVVGTVNGQQAQVFVNGVAARVSNRMFLATDVPLSPGSNVIQAVGRDRAGNAATTQITVNGHAGPRREDCY